MDNNQNLNYGNQNYDPNYQGYSQGYAPQQVVTNTQVLNQGFVSQNVTPTINTQQPMVGLQKSHKKSSKSAAVFMVTALLSMLVGAGALLLVFHFFPDLASNTVMNITKTEKEVTITDAGIADAVEKVYDSVVTIKTYKNGVVYSTGTGFVYKKNNNKYYMITNYHVIQDGNKIGIVFTDGSEGTATVEGGDKYSDIAVLSYTTTKDVKVATMGSSEKMRVGDTVFAIGTPLDSAIYSWSVTRGVLSGKDREVEVSTNNSQVTDWIMLVLQTDAAINSGNSGGPLCNSNGDVIGITNMKLVTSGVEGMGFAIPIEDGMKYADAIINGKTISRPYIGIQMVDASNQIYAQKYGIKPMDGVLLGSVEVNSPAARAGLKEGDVLIAINDVKIKNVASLRYQLYKYGVGDIVTIKYIREGRTVSTKMTLSIQ